jgi:putative transposase
MAGIARPVATGLSHHLTPRGSRRQETLLCDHDYRAYIKLLGAWCTKCGAEVWRFPNQTRAFDGRWDRLTDPTRAR